jgi:hypothetical protein
MAPVETKVKSSTAASALSGLALFVLGRYVFKGSVPDAIASWIYVLVPAAITFGAGYMAKHTPRGDLPAAVPSPQPPGSSPSAAPAPPAPPRGM